MLAHPSRQLETGFANHTEALRDIVRDAAVNVVQCVSQADNRFRVAFDAEIPGEEKRVSVVASIDQAQEPQKGSGYRCVRLRSVMPPIGHQLGRIRDGLQDQNERQVARVYFEDLVMVAVDAGENSGAFSRYLRSETRKKKIDDGTRKGLCRMVYYILHNRTLRLEGNGKLMQVKTAGRCFAAP
jgi:hypothetical protein